MQTKFKIVNLEQITGDASLRTFFRITLENQNTLIKMVIPRSHANDYHKVIFSYKFLEKAGLPVPKILGKDEKNLCLYVEDLGDIDYYRLHPKLNLEMQLAWYRKFIDYIMDISSLTDHYRKAFKGQIDLLGIERMKWEIDYFIQNYILKSDSIILSDAALGDLQNWLYKIVERAASYPVVLCHRDFHSKNIMIKDDRAYLIDFQDLRLGPFNYDLVSLIWDSYLELSDETISDLENYFHDSLPMINITLSPSNLKMYNRITAIQRNFKAIGTFAAQALMKKPGYLKYIKPTAEKIFTHLDYVDAPAQIYKTCIKLFKNT